MAIEATVAIVISVATAIGMVINALHINKCKSCCAESDCVKNEEERDAVKTIRRKNKSPPETPIILQPLNKTETTEI